MTLTTNLYMPMEFHGGRRRKILAGSTVGAYVSDVPFESVLRLFAWMDYDKRVKTTDTRPLQIKFSAFCSS